MHLQPSRRPRVMHFESQRVQRRFIVLAVGLAISAAFMLPFGGCTKPSTSDWAQTSPVMQADVNTNEPLNLGVRQ